MTVWVMPRPLASFFTSEPLKGVCTSTAIYFARGSGTDSWGELSCQLLRYDRKLVVP